MEEECDVKPDEIKLESELILDDDYGYNYSLGPCQEANSQAPSTDLLNSHPAVVLERHDPSLLNGASSTINPSRGNGGVPESTLQIKVENTEDEDPLADAALSDEWPMPSETASTFYFKEESSVFLKDFQIKSENASLEENNYWKEMTIPISSESGDKKRIERSISKSGVMKNTFDEIRVKTSEINDSASDIGQDLHDRTLSTASITSCQPDKLSEADPGKRPFRRKRDSARFNDEDEPTTKLHSGEKPFSCKHCPTRFNNKSALTRHLRIHSGEKPFSCKHCPTRFNDKSALTRHLRIHSGEKPFSCTHCLARFRQGSHLTSHLSIHSGEKPFSCKHCPTRFINKTALTRHLRIHSGKKPFSCKHCPARFNHKSSLTSHLRIHSGEKPFSCQYCPAGFNQKGDLTKHLQIHPG